MIPWKPADGEIYEYACREGDADIFHLLQMARKHDAGGSK